MGNSMYRQDTPGLKLVAQRQSQAGVFSCWGRKKWSSWNYLMDLFLPNKNIKIIII